MYFYFSFSTTKPGWLILKPHRTTVMAVRDISQPVFVAGSGRWIHMDHPSHYVQPHPLQARDMTHNHDLCARHYSNQNDVYILHVKMYIILLYNRDKYYGSCKVVYNHSRNQRWHIDVIVVPRVCRWMVPSSSYKSSLCNPWLASMPASSPSSPLCVGSNSLGSNSPPLLSPLTWLPRSWCKWNYA